MNSTEKIKRSTLLIVLLLMCGIASARGRRCPHYVYRSPRMFTPCIITRTIVRPIETTRISNRFNQRERLAMVIAYLNNNAYLSVKHYAKITGLSKEAAKAELDAFAQDNKNHIRATILSKRSVYVKG